MISGDEYNVKESMDCIQQDMGKGCIIISLTVVPKRVFFKIREYIRVDFIIQNIEIYSEYKP